MLHENLFERVLSWLVRERGEAALQEARRTFEANTGTIDERAPDYEARIAHFLEQYVCEGDRAPIALFAETALLTAHERTELAGWLRSHRSLFVTDLVTGNVGILRDCIFGGSFRVWLGELGQALAHGEYFDGRLLPLAGRLVLSPGRVYHPREAHAALLDLLATLELAAVPRVELLNGLLAMRSRFLQFESVRAEHVYQARGLAPVRLPKRTDA
jgi:hypothetical protein